MALMRALPFTALFVCLWLPLCTNAAKGTDPLSPRAVLEAAFQKLYGCDVRYELDLSIHDSVGRARRMRLEAAAKGVDGRRRVLAYITSPAYVRGMRILILEAEDGRSDAWVYRPSDERNRRISTAQRDDKFLGSDFTYDDFERRRVGDYIIDSSTLEGDVLTIIARPVTRRFYNKIAFDVALEDSAILGIRMFKGEQNEPSRVLHVRRQDMISASGCLIPTRLKMSDRSGTWSEIRFSAVEVSPALDDRLFEPGALERSYKGIRGSE